ncbi:methyl-accepting chemotaxis protein [Thermanaerovibrio velox DSM 12556]|uniref:Methyl-accepting chemotaxis protein n=1 Tax=Thermanaerovibrio velox DSM 12556 TaxID=926567 RepID=H0UR62_9BACT|nr:methyl-accepting chemotaxis protein [Thermanaerovibrio velox]EHM10899.1 methyl-accepting chemotaxis protein [Thermanaerovibrio velox DSM 12556]
MIKRSIRTKLITSILGGVILILGGLSTVTALSVRKAAMEAGLKEGMFLARAGARVVEKELQGAMDVAYEVAQVLGSMVESGNPSREGARNMLVRTLRAHKEFFGMSCGFEPNAFDGRDQEFVNKPWHDGTGRLVPYVYNDGGTIKTEPLVGYDKEGEGDWYLVPVRTGKLFLAEPYEYSAGGKKILMTTVAAPVTAHGKVIGAVTVDISLDRIQEIISGLRLFDSGFGRLISYNGVVASHKDKDRIGKPMGELKEPSGQQVLESIRRGEEWHERAWSESAKAYTLKVNTPVRVEGVDTPWSLGSVLFEKEVYAKANRLTWSLILFSAFGALALGVVVFLVATRISAPITRLSALADRAASGDLSMGEEELAIKTGDETEALSRSIYGMVSSLRQALGTITHAVADLSHSAGLVSSSSQEAASTMDRCASLMAETSSRIDRLAASQEEITASSEEVASGSQMSAQRATDMASSVEDARSSGEDGARAVVKVTETLRSVAQEADRASSMVRTLGERAGKIQSFVAQIGQIADQTNLLALNAAIEAARAGEAGKGFAVVAEEVRKLAEESNQAARQIAELADGIAQDMLKVQSASDGNAKMSQEAFAAAEEASSMIERIMERLKAISTATQDLAAVAEEQAASSGEIARAVQDIASESAEAQASAREAEAIVKEAASHVQGLEDSARDLTSLAERLKELTRGFNLGSRSGEQEPPRALKG